MVKKIINVGVEGNDASGDPIREAFIKANENFNELYSAFGKGDGISITALAEGPDEVTSNAILISNDDPNNPKYFSKELVGAGGLTIDNTDPTKIVFTASTSSLASDPTPSLIYHMDAKGFNIVNLGDPDQFTANSLGVNINSMAVNKGYADARYVNSSGDTMTGPLILAPGSTGNSAARANETVLRAGGYGSQMQGPLILRGRMRDFDDPLAAATKEYVDLSNFSSQVNLYVSTQGDDTQFDIDVSRKGRSLAYAFKTVSAACRYANTLMVNAPLTVGVNVKDITYNNGASVSVVQTITDAITHYVLRITNNGDQTDPRDAFDIRPGQVIKGKISGAIVKIEELLNVYPGYEDYRVIYQTTATFKIGEEVVYGNPVKDLNITIFVETGNYYEHYPIRVPENTSISGEELRRVIIRPRRGRSASWAIDTYFRRDTTFDQDLHPVSQLYGYHYLTDPNTTLYSDDINNIGARNNASFVLLENRAFIQEEVIGYITQVWNGLEYDEAKCYRDTGFIVDAIAYDMAFGSNFQSIATARSYYRGIQAAEVLGADRNATLAALDEIKNILVNLVIDLQSQERITDLVDLMKNIINNGLEVIPSYVWPASGTSEGFINGRNILYNNRLFLQTELVAYIDIQIEDNANTPSSIWYNLNISGERCARDIGLIIDAVCYDLTYGGNSQTILTALAYFDGAGNGILGTPEIAPTLEVYDLLKNRVYNIVTGGNFGTFQNTIPRIGGTAGSAAAGTAAQNLVEIIRFTITNNGTAPAVINPSLVSVPTIFKDNFFVIANEKTNIQGDIITFINNNFFIYDQELCKRDVGLIVDALGYDLVYGGFYKSLEAANSYFESASALIAITTQLTETTAAINYIKTVAEKVILQQPVTTSYQTAYPASARIAQNTSIDRISESGAVSIVNQLITLMVDIINEDVKVNPSKQNNELDVFLLNEATIVRNLSCQEHGGFMCVLDPLGQILTKSPYVQTASSFSRSINDKIFAGGMLVDAFAGNVQSQITQRVSDVEVLVDGLTLRLPNLPCAFYINGVRFQVDLITEWDQVGGTARVHINGRTPDDPDYTLIQDSTRLFMPSTTIEFLSAGNNSMLCNDYTQLNDLGYGLVALNGGLLEAVGVFTYYNQISYYADMGGQIRSVGGSSAHGSFGLVAANSYPLEIPDDVYLLEDMVIGATVYSPFDKYVDLGGTNLSGTGTNATFDITVNETSYLVSINNSGSGYVGGNQIVILGAEFGGITGINDLTLTVTGIGGGGSISSVSLSGTVPNNSPINDYYNRTNDIALYIHELTTEFLLPNGCEMEVVFGTAPNKEIYRYLVNNASEIQDISGLPELPNGKLYRLNLASGGLGAGSNTGLKESLVNGAKLTIRMNTSLLIYDINRETATRPSTALVFDESSAYVNRVIAISNLQAKVGTFEWMGNIAMITSQNHGIPITVYNNISGTNLSGGGVGATFNVSRNGSNYVVVVNSPGSGYNPGDQIRISGINVAILTPDHDLTITVTGVSAGGIISVSWSGNAPQPVEIYLVFLGGTNGNPSRGYYFLKNVIDADTFEIETLVPTAIFSEGAISWGSANGECEAQMKEPFRAVTLTSYYDNIDQRVQPFTTTVTRTFSSTNELNCISSYNLSLNMPIKFTGTVGGVTAGTTYYVKNVVSDTKFTISTTPGGPIFGLLDQTGTMYATSDIQGANYYTWGVTGSYKFAVRTLSEYEGQRIINGIENGFTMIMGWRGRIHRLTNYISADANNTPYAVVEIDDLIGPGLAEPVGLLEGGWDNNPNLKGVLPKDSPGNVTIQISTVRVTGHDFLEIGSGSYAQTNFPNIIFGRPDKDPDQAAEVLEIGKGRCFFVTSDQDGNFRVGDFFQVDQGTGTVTFSSSIAISNLDGLGFKRGVAIAEFSVDDSFFDNATDTVPTEQAVRTYLDRRLGITHNGAIISPASGRIIPDAVSGFMCLNGKLSMKANMNMGSYRITSLAEPGAGSDAATKNYADTKLSLLGGTMFGDIDMNGNKVINLGVPTLDADAATKKYVDDLVNTKDTLAELGDVTITGTPANNSILAYNGTEWVNGGQTGDVLFTLSGNTFTSAIQPGVIINSDVKSDAAIDQSKLLMTLATARTGAPTGTAAQKQAASGVASFDDTRFTVTDGYVTLKNNGIALSNLPQIGADTVLGNSSSGTATPDAVTFATVVQEGGGLYNGLFTTNGALVRTGVGAYSSITYKSDYSEAVPTDKGTIVFRDAASGGFSASIINATTQFNVGGNKSLAISGTSPTQYVELYNPQGTQILGSRTVSGSTTTTVYGNWVLGSGATLEATYAADIAEYYEGDKTYDVGTVVMIGGDKDITLASGAGTTRVAGVISNNAAYIMNSGCPGEKNLVALQGRVPCKVIGKIEKGDLMVVGIVQGVAMASMDPKPGSIIGKALQNYDSDHVGIIEVMVGKH